MNYTSQPSITRVITFRVDLLCLHLDNSELKLVLSVTREHAKHINFKTPSMKIEKVVLRNEWRGIRSPSLRQFVSTFSPRPLRLTEATMCTYRVQPDFQLFQNWNHFNYSQCIRELKEVKQSLTKMIARWMIWQIFSLKGKLYFSAVLIVGVPFRFGV